MMLEALLQDIRRGQWRPKVHGKVSIIILNGMTGLRVLKSERIMR